MKRLFITILCALLFGVLMPLQAQEPSFSTVTPEYTQVPPETVTAPVVVPETPEATDADTPSLIDRLSPEHVIIVVQMLIILFLTIRTGNLIPQSVVTALISEFRKAADKTPTNADDIAIDALEAVAKRVYEQETKATIDGINKAIDNSVTRAIHP